MLKIGLIREGKIPHDNRVALTPNQCRELVDQNPEISIIVEPSPVRCFPDDAYREAGMEVNNRMEDCDLLIGIKEVPVSQLIPRKTYMFFSHTIKMQAYNRDLLKSVLKKLIRLIDFELLSDEQGKRLIGFGEFAGIVGAHYGLMMYGQKTGAYRLKPAHQKADYDALIQSYQSVEFPPFKTVIAGKGNVADGARDILINAGFQEVDPETFKTMAPEHPTFTQLGLQELYGRKDGQPFDRADFKENPEAYTSNFLPFAQTTDLMINAVYWESGIPKHFEPGDTAGKDFRIKAIADISCDIEGSVPITLQHTYRDKPVYGYDPHQFNMTSPYQDHTIDIMAISNLPNELPKDASEAFGKVMKNKILPEFLQNPEQRLFKQATITHDGNLTEPFQYLAEFAQTIE